jgi:hypothetical protein
MCNSTPDPSESEIQLLKAQLDTANMSRECWEAVAKSMAEEKQQAIVMLHELLDYVADTQPEYCSCDSSENHQCQRCRAEELLVRAEGDKDE